MIETLYLEEIIPKNAESFYEVSIVYFNFEKYILFSQSENGKQKGWNEMYDDSDVKEYKIRKKNSKNINKEEDLSNQEKEEALQNLSDEDMHIKEMGALPLDGEKKHRIELLTVIGEVEGHEAVSGNTKATKYEHILPKLAQIENSTEVDGVLILLNTLGGDVEAGLAIAEMIASLSKPTVSLVLGGCHSIGGPLAVSADYSFIVPSGTMIIHPVRSSGMFIGVAQSLRNMEKTQDRITGFLADHSRMTQERIEELMLDSTQLVKDVGTMLEGSEAVCEGLIDEVGGISEALKKLHEMIAEKREKTDKN